MINEELIELIINNSKTTLEIEGLRPSLEATNITKEYLRGNLTSEQAISLIISLHVGKINKTH